MKLNKYGASGKGAYFEVLVSQIIIIFSFKRLKKEINIDVPLKRYKGKTNANK